MKTIISTKNLPVGPYSTAVMVDNTLYCSGQIAIGNLDAGIAGQTQTVCNNILDILKVANMDISDIVKTTCFLSDIEIFDDFNKIYEKYFTHKPARSCVAVKALPKNAAVEIEFIAVNSNN